MSDKIVTRRRRVVASAVVLLAFVMSALASTPGSAAPSPDRRPSHAKVDLTLGRLPAPPRPPDRRPDLQTAATTDSTATADSAATADSTAKASVTRAKPAPPPTAVAGSGPGVTSTGPKTLVVYDDGGEWGWLGELYGQQTANLVSHFGSWAALPVSKYTAGMIGGYDAVVYAGSTYDQVMPPAFLTDVSSTTKPVIWMYDNIWQLMAADPTFSSRNGWNYKQFDFSTVGSVAYKGQDLYRYAANPAGIMDLTITDATKAQVLATAKRADGTTFPWAVRSGSFTYIGEIPFAYVDHGDRYLAFSDLLFDALAPGTATRHRALVRIEDVGPDSDPGELRALADYLYSQNIPFSVAVYPRYVDPKGVNNGGVKEAYDLRTQPAVVSALKYMQSKGGTLLMHGYTHQYGTEPNPYDGVSANDFEFYTAHIDLNNNVVYDGPVPDDSTKWANGRLDSAARAFTAAGLAVPTIFEFPHYAGSAVDYKAVAARFSTRYDRGLYFGGLFGGTANYSRLNGQYFPYVVRDIYGTKVIPETVGNVEPEPFNNHPARFPDELVRAAEQNLVVRDGFASFFYHPYLGTDYLKTTVEGIRGLGYTFVAGSSL